jgi:hypothetical protein
MRSGGSRKLGRDDIQGRSQRKREGEREREREREELFSPCDLPLLHALTVSLLALQEREKVASEWLELSLDVPKSHTSIKRWQLNKLMGIEDKAASVSENGSFQ